MRHITKAFIAASALAIEGFHIDVPMYEGTAPHVRTSKPMTHGRRCKRPLTERKARRAKRRQKSRQ